MDQAQRPGLLVDREGLHPAFVDAQADGGLAERDDLELRHAVTAAQPLELGDEDRAVQRVVELVLDAQRERAQARPDVARGLESPDADDDPGLALDDEVGGASGDHGAEGFG